jgi:hypothetical protein
MGWFLMMWNRYGIGVTKMSGLTGEGVHLGVRSLLHRAIVQRRSDDNDAVDNDNYLTPIVTEKANRKKKRIHHRHGVQLCRPKLYLAVFNVLLSFCVLPLVDVPILQVHFSGFLLSHVLTLLSLTVG